MSAVAGSVVTLVAVLHVYFLVLEMFLWQTPFGMKTFGTTPEVAASCAVLAANQGLTTGSSPPAWYGRWSPTASSAADRF